MEENLKGRAILILGISNVIFLLLFFGSCNNERNFKTARDKEMNIRLESEQKLDELAKQKTGLEDKISKVQGELAQEKAELEATKKNLSQEQMISNSLKIELEKISKLKEALEEDLKDALIKGKLSAPQKAKK